jgi:hypothetical protein
LKPRRQSAFNFQNDLFMPYPQELFHNANNTYRIVHGPEEHDQKKAEGWVDARTKGVTYKVHTACPPLTAQQMTPPPANTAPCAQCEELKRQFKAAWVRLSTEHDELVATHQELLDKLNAVGVSQSPSDVGLKSPEPPPADESPVDAEPGDAVPQVGPSKLKPPLKGSGARKAQPVPVAE